MGVSAGTKCDRCRGKLHSNIGIAALSGGCARGSREKGSEVNWGLNESTYLDAQINLSLSTSCVGVGGGKRTVHLSNRRLDNKYGVEG